MQSKIIFCRCIAIFVFCCFINSAVQNCKLAKYFVLVRQNILLLTGELTGTESTATPGPLILGAAEVWPVVDWSNDVIAVQVTPKYFCLALHRWKGLSDDRVVQLIIQLIIQHRILSMCQGLSGKDIKLHTGAVRCDEILYSRIVFSNRFIILISEN